ncbi:hypothetical protein [Pseudanabaena sp. FACHB-2040]|uniref:hypothetical protein n=1 Tax=Pseudanabaena sp. FACHB-2040 TaxID=2692859 RepID=UPI00168867AB|nr:hypothetical protein [Pseudanabaena sp. FACHB-2040]MBD2257540.1 hypothetical protein [Pseudanabaena sp. FACHB-2040]
MNKAFFLSVAVVFGVVGGVAAYSWTRATHLPTWYTAASQPLPEQVGTANDLLVSKMVTTDSADAPLSITLTEAEVNQVVLGAIAQEPSTAQLLEAAKGINTSLENNQIESGMVVNLSDIPPGALPAQGQQALSQLTQRFPVLADRDIYIGVKGSPRIDAGRLVLDENTVVTIGRFQLPLAELASQVGLSQEQLEAQLGQALAQSGITLQDIQIQEGQLVISGASQ